MKDQFFVSYSRDQLYYAESVVHSLQEKDINIWFDLQQLEPGTAWATEIESGLNESSSLILIASRSSLQSPYVAVEWMHALEEGKPIYIVLFEEVDFKPFTTQINGDMKTVPLDELYDKATAIVDGRGNYRTSISRLSDSLSGNTQHKDTPASVNRFRFPLRLPIPVAFIAASMAILTMISMVITFTVFSAFLPMTTIGVIASVYCGLQTWSYIRRRSYQGTRVILAIAPIYAYLFAVWFTPIAITALYFAIYSDDVHRWSPRGEGNNPRDLVLKKRRPFWQRILPFIVLIPLLFLQPGLLWLVLIIWFFVRNRNVYDTHRHGETVVTLLIFSTLFVLVDPILAIPLILILAAIANRRQNPIEGTIEKSGITYLLHAQPEDVNIGKDIEDALKQAGVEPLEAQKSDVAPDYHIVVVSEFGDPPKIEDLLAKGGKIIVVVASSIMDWERVQSFGDYQWVDYRKQDPERLMAMARDLREGQESNSFNTRIVPQSFEKLVIPSRILVFTLVQLFFYSISLFRVTRSLITGADVNLVLLIFSLISLVVSFWIVERILNRRITGSTMVKINMSMAFSLNILILIIGLLQPLPPGYQRHTGLILVFLVVNVISVFIFYRIGKFQVNTIMKWWLPSMLPTKKGKRNKQMTQVTIVSGLMTILFTISFFGPDVPLSHARVLPAQVDYQLVKLEDGLSLETPVHWLDIPKGIQDEEITPYILNAPVSTVLMKANGPLNEDLALTINSFFQSPFAGQTLTIGFLELLGDAIDNVFRNIAFNLSPGSTPWRPENYGSPMYTAVYVPNGEIDDTLILTLWKYDTDAPFVSSVSSVVTNARTASNTQSVQQSIIEPTIVGFDSEVTAIRLEEDTSRTVIVVTLDTSRDDYFITISGSDRILREVEPVLEYILESIDF